MLILRLAIKPWLRLLHIGSTLNSTHGSRWNNTCHCRTCSDHQWHISCREGEEGIRTATTPSYHLLIMDGGCCSCTSEALSASDC
jgi:hypothetical protein